MNVIKNTLLVIVCLCNISCAKAEQSHESDNHTNVQNYQTNYQRSDELINQSYNKLSSYFSSSILKINLKNEQITWLKSRAKICGLKGLQQPKDYKQMICAEKENTKRIQVLNFAIKHLNHIANQHFTAFNLQENKLIPNFQSDCLCDKNIPYIDLKQNKFILYNVCDNKTIIIKHEITKVYATNEYIDFEILNNLDSKYHVIFKPQKKYTNVYLIITGGHEAVIDELNIPAYLAPSDKDNKTSNDACVGFDG